MDFTELRDSFLPFLNNVPILKAILGVIIVFFVPGFAWTLALFNKINIIERIALTIGISIATVTLSVLILNLAFKIDINGNNALITIAVITAIGLAVYLTRRYMKRRSRTKEA
jgi:uncharacterized membrane protein